MKRQIAIALLGFSFAFRAGAQDLYGATPTARAIALGGIYLGSPGPTDALASNPAALTSLDRPYLEVTGMSVFAGGQFRNSTPFAGSLENNAGLSGSAAFGAQIPGTRLSIGAGAFPVSLMSDKWRYQDPPGTAGASYGIQNDKSAFLAIQSTVGAGFQISPGLSIGGAFGIVDNLNTLETPYVFQTNPALAGLKTLLDLHTSGIGYNGTFGLIAQPARRLQFGLTYKTRTTIRSTGSASGNAYAQFSALGLPYPSGFHYDAEVDNVFPQSASASLAWQARRRLRTYLQTDWTNWHDAFVQLPVHLTNGNNALLNTILQSTSLNDSVPLHWSNQLAVKIGFDVSVAESFTVQGGYSHANSPVPAATLTPLTAAIMTDTLSTGVGYEKNRFRVQFGYEVNLPQTAQVGTSSLLAGEYSNTRTSLWVQTIALTTGIRF